MWSVKPPSWVKMKSHDLWCFTIMLLWNYVGIITGWLDKYTFVQGETMRVNYGSDIMKITKLYLLMVQPQLCSSNSSWQQKQLILLFQIYDMKNTKMTCCSLKQVETNIRTLWMIVGSNASGHHHSVGGGLVLKLSLLTTIMKHVIMSKIFSDLR